MFCTRVAWACLVCLLLCKEEGSSPVSAITERRDMGLYEVPLSVSLLGFGIGIGIGTSTWLSRASGEPIRQALCVCIYIIDMGGQGYR